MKSLELVLLFFVFSAKAASASYYQTVITPQLQNEAHNFMKLNRMILKEEEITQNEVTSEWRILKILRVEGKILLVMNLNTIAFGVTSLGDGYEVLALDSKGKIAKFEVVFKIPPTLRAAIGSDEPDLLENGTPSNKLPDDFFYVEFRGVAALAAFKSVYGQISKPGFSGNVTDKKGKLDFDPTSNRTWQVTNAAFDLRRGTSIEINDGRPKYFDQDFKFYAENSKYYIEPWAFSVIRKIWINGYWKEIVAINR
jgi:hypothetical protein